MRVRDRRALLSVPLAVVMAAGGAALAYPAQAAATVTAAFWSMDEPPGATTMGDSSGHGINGSIGTEVRTGVNVSGATGYRFPYLAPNQPPTHPEHLVTVPSTTALNPDSQDYAVTIRYRTTKSFGNILQKGQNKTAGGYWKFEQPKGFVTCLFKGSTGEQRAVKSKIALNDGQWHVVRCERTATGLTMYVDGARMTHLSGTTGRIANTWELSIGGKPRCDQIKVTCDYFVGDVDYVRIEKG